MAMGSVDAVKALAALAQETRLAIFRVLVAAGPSGVMAGVLSERLGVPPPTLTFHLKELEAARLVERSRQGRNVIYTAHYLQMRSLLTFLTEDCCKGRPEICGNLQFATPEESTDQYTELKF